MSPLLEQIRRALVARLGAADRHRPIVLIDYCRIRDKYEFLAKLGAALEPRRLVVVDGFRGGHRRLPHRARTSVTVIEAPREVFWRPLRPVAPWRGYRCEEPWLSERGDRYRHLLEERFHRVDTRRAVRCVATAHGFAAEVIDRVDPAFVIVWNAFHPLSQAARDAARARAVPAAYIEYGLLPGTLNFDFQGQMGESAVATEPAKFDALPVTEEQLATADAALAALRRSGANRRYQQRTGTVAGDLRARARGRPIVLLAGHNDHASGVIPYDERARAFHSPIFASSAQAARAVATVASKRGWLVAYKPHPFAANTQHVADHADLAALGNVSINECIDAADVVVTILSQVSYVGLIREKPVVMLGYNQLRGKRCVYQAEEASEVAAVIEDALANGFTAEQRAAWRRHVARLLTRYLYRYEDTAPAAQPPDRLAATLERALETRRFTDLDVDEPARRPAAGERR